MDRRIARTAGRGKRVGDGRRSGQLEPALEVVGLHEGVGEVSSPRAIGGQVE
ncbi:hypothetical protein WME89_33020 [Sorangium sp. So ce321]|uniref:hypothetical protein n=1 Tax=Sorangium sp. So ce321 TaxID=3133300 RepID=UPI003F6234F4